MVAAAFALALLGAAPSPAGLETHNSECASGGFDYFFFADGVVIAKCWGCESRPNVQAGRWRRDADAIRVEMDREWLGTGRGRIVEVASVNVFEEYAAVARSGPVRTDQSRFDAEDLDPDRPRDGCGEVRRHLMPEDPHAFLRLFDGVHPETYRRLLDPAELAGRSAQELRLMRNEIFARYGLRFRDPALRVHFAAQKGYDGWMSDVDAFLSEVERENVARLLAAERAVARATAG